MFKKNKIALLTNSALVLLTGCASYEAATLSMLPSDTAIFSRQEPNVLVSWKAYDKEDCEKYLDRNVISQGYIPVQLTIRNNTDDPMHLSPNNFSIPISSPGEVANKVHTSTGGRVAAWGVGGLVFFPLLVPAVVDGFKSAQANEALDADYMTKALKEQAIEPHSLFNGVVFIPKEHEGKRIEMYLVNKKTNQKVGFSQILVSQ